MIFEGICKLLCEIKISELGFFGYKVTSIANIMVYRLHKGNTNFQLEVSENKDIIFSPYKFTKFLNFIHGSFRN